MARRSLRVDCFSSPTELREYLTDRYGPTITVFRANAEDPERCAALDRDLDALAECFAAADGSMEWGYLLVTARRS
jgi:hypothetical protein